MQQILRTINSMDFSSIYARVQTHFSTFEFLSVLRTLFILCTFQMLITIQFKLHSMLALIRNFHAWKQPQPLTQPITLYMMEADKSNGDNRTYAFNRQHYSLNNTPFFFLLLFKFEFAGKWHVCPMFGVQLPESILYALEQSWAA